MKDLESKATAAQAYADAANVAMARQRWNADHPDATPMDVDGWLARADKAEQLFLKLSSGETLSESETAFLADEPSPVRASKPPRPALAEFRSRIDAKVASGTPRHRAASEVVHADPSLHRQVVVESNS